MIRIMVLNKYVSDLIEELGFEFIHGKIKAANMKVILYCAISSDGFIAKKNGDSNWVTDLDSQIFEGKIKEVGCIIMGRKTYEQYHGELYPFKGVLNLVVTHSKFDNKEKETFFVNSPKGALKVAGQKGFEEVLLIGGGTINGSFLKDKLIDEILVDIHPLVLGAGIKVFEGYEGDIELGLLESKILDQGQILLHYRLIYP